MEYKNRFLKRMLVTRCSKPDSELAGVMFDTIHCHIFVNRMTEKGRASVEW